ncbi:MAG: ABC transporter ATP-binding protein [Brevinema sp.]
MVKFTNVSQTYGNFKALHDVSFEIPDKTLVALLGPNGAGKSTTMNIMTGFRPPIDGEVMINGVDIFNEPENAKQYIGYLGEIPPLYPELTVFEYLTFVAELRGMDSKIAAEKAEEALVLVQIENRKNALIKNLSKGLKQRVGIAQSILHKPKLLVLDEPTVGLEPSQLIEFRNLIRSLASEHGMTVVISTHIMSEASELCDHVIIINEGRKIFDGSKELLLDQNQGSYHYQISLTKTPNETLLSKIRSYKEVTEISFEATTLQIKLQDDIIPDIVEVIVLEKFGVKEVLKTKNSLEKVFLQLTDKKEAAHE